MFEDVMTCGVEDRYSFFKAHSQN